MSTPFCILKGNYYQDILDQPAALAATVQSLKASRELLVLADKLQTGAYDKVVLTGMGSSFHGFHPLHLRLLGQGIPSLLMETSELIHYGQGLLGEKTLVVAMSQSGKSAETVRLLEINGGRSAVIGVTNTAESPLAAKSHACVLTRAGSEHTVSCKTYVSALAANAWLGDLLCGTDPAATLGSLAKAADMTGRFLADLDEKMERLARTLEGVRSLFYVGRGASMASVGTGALITKEAAKFHAEGMSSAAFRHGPLEMVNPEIFVHVFSGNAATADLNARLLEDIVKNGGRGSLYVPETDSAVLMPILEILDVQVFTLALAALKNHEAGSFRYATKVTASE